MQKRAGLLLALVLALATASVVSAGKAYAHELPEYAHDGDDMDCAKEADEEIDGFSLTLDSSAPVYNKGEPVIATATANIGIDPNLHRDFQVRFIWYNVNTGEEEHMVTYPIHHVHPNNTLNFIESDTQTFNPPNPTQYEVLACLEERGATEEEHHMLHMLAFQVVNFDAGSFMVLPESAVGAVALASAPIAALGFYLYRKNSL